MSKFVEAKCFRNYFICPFCAKLQIVKKMEYKNLDRVTIFSSCMSRLEQEGME